MMPVALRLPKSVCRSPQWHDGRSGCATLVAINSTGLDGLLLAHQIKRFFRPQVDKRYIQPLHDTMT